MENREQKKYAIDDFRKEMVEVSENQENEGDFPEEIDPNELTGADMVIWQKIRGKTIESSDIIEYKKNFEKENGFKNKSRYYFLMFVSNKANVIIGNRELSMDK